MEQNVTDVGQYQILIDGEWTDVERNKRFDSLNPATGDLLAGHSEALGVVAAVVPWNPQLFLTAVKMAPALAAGNAAVLKASEHASTAMLELGGKSPVIVFDDAGIESATYRVVSPVAEFGGFKNSGYGRESDMQAIYDYTRVKTIWLNTSSEPMANPFVMRQG
jgi:acyl-CoA reductase-like NAD-dependent aldehyde dehydrogenase